MLLHFENPEFLWGLAGIAGLAWLMFALGKRQPESYSSRRLVTATLAFALCVLGLSRPQLGHQTTESRSARFNLFLALDISRSMMAEDISPTRLQFSVAFSQKLLSFLPGARVALFPFAGDGFIQMPLSNDLDAASEMLQALDPGMTTNQGTDFTVSMQTLFERIHQMEQSSEKYGAGWAPPQVLLFSDGESHVPVANNVIKLYRDARIPIHTVGVGTTGGASLMILGGMGSLTSIQQPRGQTVRTRLDERSLRALSDGTGGTFFTASFAEVGRVVQRLTQSLQLGKLSVKFKSDQELFPFLFGLALLLFSLEFCLGRWQYSIRGLLPWLLIAAFAAANPVRAEEIDFDVPAEMEPPLEPEPPPLEKKMDDQTKAIVLFNKGLEELKGGKMDKAAEHFQESAFVTPDKIVRKKALYNLGNTLLRNMDPQQALQVYQEAYDTKTDDDAFDKATNQKISENITLATRLQQQMKGQNQEEKEGGKDPKDENKEGKDRGGPQKDYEAQPLTESEKKKVFDVISAEEQQILKRQMEKKNKGKPKDPNAKQW